MFRTLQSLVFTDFRLDRLLSLWSIQNPCPNQKSEVCQSIDLNLVNWNQCLPSFELDFFELSTSDRSLTSSIVMDTDQVKNITLYSGFYSVVFIKYISLKYAHMKHNMPSTYHNKCY